MEYQIPVEELVNHIMIGHWKMEKPKIVVVIVSNAAPLKEWKNDRQTSNFVNGIIKVNH